MDISISRNIIQLLSAEQAWNYKMIPFEKDGKVLSVWTSNIDELDLINEAEFVTNLKISCVKKNEDEIIRLLNHFYRRNDSNDVSNNQTFEFEDFLHDLISEAKNLESSDIHIESYEETARVRIRVDGHLIEKYTLSKKQYPELVNKIKILSNLDITEKRLPQDGRINFKHGNQKFDIRVSVCPTLYGEKAVLRLLNNDASNIDISALGMSEKSLNIYLNGIKKPNGIILISGPTGSGKTTTLYATLKELNSINRNILTVEDPIEYTLEGVNQVQLKEDIGLTFSAALKSFLRQDPDIIMLGEIRDGETAQMAIRASLTGHLVLSTIHTNSAWGIISRLIDMGVPRFLIANTINLAVAQRLVRKLCNKCKVTTTLNNTMLSNKLINEINFTKVAQPTGCEFCHFTGYKGRIALHEIIPVNDRLKEVIITDNNEKVELDKMDVDSLKKSALQLLEAQETSCEEVYGIVSE